MLYTISWMVTRDGQIENGPWSGILSWFLAGGLTGGMLMGAIIAFPARELYYIGGPHPAAFVVAAAVLSALYALRAADIWPVPKPQSPHQVPEAWRNIFRPRVASFIYAVGLGAIYFTRLGSLAAYPLALLLIGMGRTPAAIMEVMGAVGLLRASTTLLVPLRRLDRAGGDAVLGWMEARLTTVRRGEVIVLLGLVCLPILALLNH